MKKAGLYEVQTGIKTVGRNINNLRYADDTTLKEESESLLMSPEYSPEGLMLKLMLQYSGHLM